MSGIEESTGFNGQGQDIRVQTYLLFVMGFAGISHKLQRVFFPPLQCMLCKYFIFSSFNTILRCT